MGAALESPRVARMCRRSYRKARPGSDERRALETSVAIPVSHAIATRARCRPLRSWCSASVELRIATRPLRRTLRGVCALLTTAAHPVAPRAAGWTVAIEDALHAALGMALADRGQRGARAVR